MNDVGIGNPGSNATTVEETDIREILAIFLDEWHWIASITLAAVLAAIFYLFVATPVYRTN